MNIFRRVGPLVVLVALLSCDTTRSVDEDRVLVSADYVRTISADLNRSFWQFAGQPDAAEYARYDVEIYRIVYESVDEDGNPLDLSGAMLIPAGSENPGLLSIQHATIFSNDEAPSVDRSVGTQFSVPTRKSVFAASGYVVFLPDYIGYGVSADRLHPYQHAESLASASYDMIVAGLEFLEEEGISAQTGQIHLAGYSEGAYASLALARELEKSSGLPDVGLISMGSPIFDISSTKDYIIDRISDPAECVPCYGFFLYSYHSIYNLSRSLDDYFQPPYLEEIKEGLFDGGNSAPYIRQTLPDRPDDLFTSGFIERYRDGEEEELTDAIAENDLFYIPEADVLLVHGDADGVAPVFNSDDFVARADQSGKSNITYIRPEGVNHTDGVFNWGMATLEALAGSTDKIAVRNK